MHFFMGRGGGKYSHLSGLHLNPMPLIQRKKLHQNWMKNKNVISLLNLRNFRFLTPFRNKIENVLNVHQKPIEMIILNTKKCIFYNFILKKKGLLGAQILKFYIFGRHILQSKIAELIICKKLH
jgi:hypothetical protein